MRLLFLFGSILWTGVWWFIAWSNTPLFSEYSFFPLWIGYILTLNAVSEGLLHNSLIRRMRASFLWLFVISIPSWWFFEYLKWAWALRPLTPTRRSLILIVLAGVISFCVMPFFPNEIFPLVWVAPLLIIDPFNYALGFPSVLVISKAASGQYLSP